MLSFFGGGGSSLPVGSAGGALAGSYPYPTLAAGQVPIELGYVELTASQTGISATVLTDITGLTLTVTVGSRPILIGLYCPQVDAGSSAGQLCQVAIIDVTAGVQIQAGQSPGTGSFIHISRRVHPAAGMRTYKVQAKGDGSTVGRFLASATLPAYLHINEV